MILKQLTSNCHKVISGKRTYFSYETCVAYEDDNVAIRLDQKFSATTTRHLPKMGVKEFTPVSEDCFYSFTS
jgi:hypothetical protein